MRDSDRSCSYQRPQGGRATASSDLSPGSAFLGYRIERILGRGGMGVVYLAHQLVLDRMVALKLLAPGLAGDERFRVRFLRESRMAAALDHPSIVPVYDAGETDGRLYIVMRYIEGTDLSRILDDEAPLSAERSLALLRPIGDALDAAAAKGLVHRDVKPSNIVVDTAGRSYLADFGLSGQTSEHGRVEASHFAGSVHYVAPEQIAGEPAVPATDVYALGCVLFECLTGRPPFEGGSPMAVLFAHLEEQPPASSERLPGLPTAVDVVLQRALAKRPEERHKAAGELIAEAEQTLGIGGHPRSRALRRSPAMAAVVMMMMLAVAAAIALLVSMGGGAPATAELDSLVRIDAKSNRVTKRIPVGHGVGDVALGLGAVWMTAAGDSSLWRIEPETGKTRSVTGLANPGSVAVAGEATRGSVYVGNYLGVIEVSATLSPATPVAGLAPVEWNIPPISAGKLGVWIADSTGPSVRRLAVDPNLGATNVVASIRIPRGPDETTGFNAISSIAVGETAIWVTGDAFEHVLFRVDPVARRVTRIPLPSAPGAVAADGDAVWVAGQLEDVVWRIDPVSGVVTDTLAVGRGISDLAAGPDGVWAASALDGTVTRIDPESREVVETVEVGGVPQGVAVRAGEVWVASRDG
jgi:streptogramin lyase/predicted Ser/Thr protein kinase